MNIKIRIIFLFALIIFFPECSGSDKISFYRASERADVDIIAGRAGLIRTVYCDIYIEYVDRENWKYLKKFKIFNGGGKGFPVDPCFHFIILNTWNKPFVVEKIEASYKGEIFPSEDYSFIKDTNYTQNRFSVNIKSLLKKRRILSDSELFTDIDFEKETLEYRLDYIAPGDRISCFTFFPRIPSGKTSRIRVVIKYFDMKKVIDFDIGRFDYKEIDNGL